MKVEILYFAGCPSYETLLAHLDELLGGAGIRVEIGHVEVADDDAAQRARFLGSPTVRVAGLDVEPGAEARTDYGLRCRLYRTPDGLCGMPQDEWILAALSPDARA